MCETLDEIHDAQLSFVIEKIRKKKEIQNYQSLAQ